MAQREQGRSTVAGERRQSSRRNPAASDAQAALEAEITRLREANARLTAARDVVGSVRPLGSKPVERGNLADETAQMLVEGLVIRESLIEICQEMERSLVSFEARLDALATAADELVPLHGKPEKEQEGGGDVVDG